MEKIEIESLLECILETEWMDLDIPTEEDWESLEKCFECKLPLEFKYFIELMTKYIFPGDILNVSSGKTNSNDTISFTYEYEIEHGKWDKELIPFYSIGNGDYFCLHSKEGINTGVYYYSHEEDKIKKEADSFKDWIKNIHAFLLA